MVSQELFYQRMYEYNTAMFPVMILTNILGILLIIMYARHWKYSDKITAATLSFLWLWNGFIELILFFGTVSTQYYVWGLFWIFQSFLFFRQGVYRSNFHFAIMKDVYSVIGLLTITYALLIYPVLGVLSSHGYPHGPIFGIAPCPVCTFTFGILMLNRKKLPVYIIIFPLLWSLTGIYAVVKLNVYQDLGLVFAGMIGTVLLIAGKKVANDKEGDKHGNATKSVEIR
jgi:hypothetical protein